MRSAKRALLLSLLPVACSAQFRFGATEDAASDSSDLDVAEVRPPCRSDADCALGSLHCDLASGTCVPCLTSAHCITKALPVCDVALHRCVECGAPVDCLAGFVCEARTRTCVHPCIMPADCTTVGSKCDKTRGFCIECEADGGCTDKGERHICDQNNGRCVQCTLDSQCVASRLRCDLATGTCVRCISSADCPPDRPVCDPAKGDCV